MTTKPHAQLGDRNSVRVRVKMTPPKQRCGTCAHWALAADKDGRRVCRDFHDSVLRTGSDWGTGCAQWEPKVSRKPTPPKRGKGGRWSTLLEVSGGAPYRFCYRNGGPKENPSEWAEVHVVCGPKGTAARIVRALNAARVVLPARRERG